MTDLLIEISYDKNGKRLQKPVKYCFDIEEAFWCVDTNRFSWYGQPLIYLNIFTKDFRTLRINAEQITYFEIVEHNLNGSIS